MASDPFPGGLSELDFVDAYQRTVLRKPQVIADAILKNALHADAFDRALLVGAVAVELAEACRRLAAVHIALSDRRYSIARTLMNPLPGAREWQEFAQQAGTFTPEQMLRELNLPESAFESAKLLRAQPDLGGLTELVETAETGSGMVIVPAPDRSRSMPVEAWLAGRNAEGFGIASALPVSENDTAALADITADMVSIARGFLGAYLSARRTAGRR